MTFTRAKLFGVVVALVMYLMSSNALADAPRVLLVYPSEAEPSVSAALVRAREELVADGFDVFLVKVQPGTSRMVQLTDRA